MCINTFTFILEKSSFMRLSPLSNKIKQSFFTMPGCLITRKPKVLVIMGATGSGKSKLSIDLATRFFPGSEIINSDKIQIHRGLDITTNKMPMSERKGVPHHLLGSAEPDVDITPALFCLDASEVISDVARRGKLPVLVGGSNSVIYSLLAAKFSPGSDVFHPSKPDSFCSELRYDCCFLWVDVAMPVLEVYLAKRVDEMLDSGMFTELTNWFKTEGVSDSVEPIGLRKAIGVPEFEAYFRKYMFASGDMGKDSVRKGEYDEAVKAVKDNTCELARRQVEKIERLKGGAKWELNKVDATAAFKVKLGGGDVAEIWEKQVVEPSVGIVKRFLEE